MAERATSDEYPKFIRRTKPPAKPPAHLQAETPGWDTKTRCRCGEEFRSRCEFWKHQADAYVALVSS